MARRKLGHDSVSIRLNMHLSVNWMEDCFNFFYNSLQILRDAQTLAERMYHRGACACDNDTGDGAGVLTAIPHHLYTKEL